MDVFAVTLNYDSESLVRKDSSLYLIENGHSYLVNKEIITIKPKEGAEAIVKELNVVRSNILGYYDVSRPKDVKFEDYLAQLKKTGAFESIDINTFGSYEMSANDTYYGNQWYLNRIQADDAWDITSGSSSVKIAILDSGVYSDHPDIGYGNDGYSNFSFTLGNNSTPTYYHGTFVAGIIGAKKNNSSGIAGICGGNNSQGATIISYKIGNLDPDASIVDDAILDAVTDGAKIINMSFGITSSSAIEDAISYAYSHGVTLVASSGNDYQAFIKYPASNSNVIAVGATDSTNLRAPFSNYGTELEIVAPGTDIYSTCLSGCSYYYSSGTSFAAPQVSATIALLLSIDSIQPDSIRAILKRSATKISSYTFNNSGWNQEVGYGLLNVYEALKAFAGIIGSETLCLSNTYSLDHLSSDYSVTWSLSGSEASNFIVQPNTPSARQCTITRKPNGIFNSSYYTLNLTAHIVKNGVTVFTRTRTLKGFSGFTCTYKEPAFSYNGVSYPAITETPLTNCNATYVYPMGQVTLTSEFFKNKNITTSGPYNQFQTFGLGTIKFSLVPMSYSTDPLTITVWGQDCDPTVTMTFYPMASPINYSYSLNINQINGNSYEVSLIRDNEATAQHEGRSSSNILLQAEPQSWQVELYNTEDGRKVLQREIKGELHYTLNTQGLKAGVYVVKVIVEDKTLTEKINIR